MELVKKKVRKCNHVIEITEDDARMIGEMNKTLDTNEMLRLYIAEVYQTFKPTQMTEKEEFIEVTRRG